MKHLLFLSGLVAATCLGLCHAEAEIVNVAPQCRLGSTPYAGFTLNQMVDGRTRERDRGIFSHYEFGFELGFNMRTAQTDMRLGASMTLAMPEPIKVRTIRIHRTQEKLAHVVEADVTGDGRHETRIGTIPSGTAVGAVSLDVGQVLHAVRITASEGSSPVFFGIDEVEILAESRGVSESETVPSSVLRPSAPEPFSTMNEPLDGAWKRTLYLFGAGVHGDPEAVARRAVELGVNTVVLYTHLTGTVSAYREGAYTLPEDPLTRRYINRMVDRLEEEGKTSFHIASWPSRVIPGLKTNLLGPTLAAFHRVGVRVIASQSLIFFDTVTLYPRGGQSDWHNQPATPCLTQDDFVFAFGSAIHRELLDLGADGVVLGGDEFRSEGHRLSNLGLYDPCVEVFTRTHGYPNTLASLPLKAEDSLRYRQWKIHEYQGVARLFARWTEDLKRTKPDAIAANLFIADFGVYSDRMWSNLAFDLLGRTGMNYLTTDYYNPLTVVKLLAAAHAERKAGYTWTIGPFRPAYIPFARPIDTYGPVLGVVGQSGRELASIDFYENRHIFPTSRPTEWTDARATGLETVTKTFRMLQYLEREGMAEAQTPRRIALLVSRTSEDWWQLKNDYVESASLAMLKQQWGEAWQERFLAGITPERNAANHRQMLARTWHQAVMDLFASRGYPYDVHYLDQPEALGDLCDYDVLVVPFGYSVSEAAAAQVKAAVAKGASLLLINRLGEVDEWGEPHIEPIFAPLAAQGDAVVQRMDIDGQGEADLAEVLLPIVDRGLRGEMPRFSIPGSPLLYGQVFGFFLDRGDRRFVTLINFSQADAVVRIDLPGKIERLRTVSLEGVASQRLSLGASDGFHYSVPAGTGVVLVVD